MRQIIAIGGGGFSMEPDNPMLDDYVLAQSPRSVPKVCFVPTASRDAEGYIAQFYEHFKSRGCIPSHLAVWDSAPADLESVVLDQDVIYVGGGNTQQMLVRWHDCGLDGLLERAWENGVILAGISAGSMCWFEIGITATAGTFTVMEGLGFLPGSHCPHYDSAAPRRQAYRRMLLDQHITEGIAVDDGVALHYVGTELNCAVSSRPTARAYRVRREGGEIAEEVIAPRYLASR